MTVINLFDTLCTGFNLVGLRGANGDRQSLEAIDFH